MQNKLQYLSIRGKQAYAALCLVQFCAAKRITHVSITQLVEHLLSILVADNLPDWERKGACIELTGRGDPLPVAVKEVVPEHLRQTFCCLVDSVVEVGIINMYGATNEEPFRFLYQCMNILEKNGVKLPLLEDVLGLIDRGQQESNGWGNPINDEEYKKIIETYKRISV